MTMQQDYTVAGIIRAQVAVRPDEIMFVDRGIERSWRDQYLMAGRVADALVASHVGPNDRVAFLDRNGLAYFDLLFGAALMGAVLVPVNWRLAPVEMAAVIHDSTAAVLVVHQEYLDSLATLPELFSQLKHVIVLESPEGVPEVWPHASSAQWSTYDTWLDGRQAADPGHLGAPQDVSLQLYTSGTTGLPKGVMLTNANIATAVSESDRTFLVGPDTVSLVAMPLFHIGGVGWALCGMSRGGRSVVLRDVDPVEVLRLIEAERITEMFIVPAVLMFMLATPELATTDLSSLRNIFYGASPITEDVLVRCITAFACGFNQVYGMTETTGAITALLAVDHDPDGPRRHLLRSAGKPHPHVEVAILRPGASDALAVGEVGEIWTRSPYNMAGYWQKDEETSVTINGEGWLRTGDAGYLDEDGYLYLHDRIKDMIVTGGENVYPAEIENALLSHPDVVDAAVIGVPDDRWGETVKGIVVLANGAVLDEASIIEHCRSQLAHYKCPTSMEATDVLPRNPSGKILKRQLREPYWVGQERNIN